MQNAVCRSIQADICLQCSCGLTKHVAAVHLCLNALLLKEIVIEISFCAMKHKFKDFKVNGLVCLNDILSTRQS